MIKKFFSFKVLFMLVLFTGFMSCDKDNTGLEQDLTEFGIDEDIDLRELTYEIAELDLDLEMSTIPNDFAMRKGKKCFTLVFPVTMIFPDGTTQEFNSREEMGTAIKAWRQDHPDIKKHPEFQFPLTVTLRDGNTKTFETKEEFGEFMKNCRGDHPKKDRIKRCFTPVFPLTIVFPDGSEKQVDSQEDLRTAMKEWKQANPNVTGHPEFKFPFDVTLKNGNVVTVNSKEDLKNIVKGCKGDIKHKPHFKKCFKVVFPITIEFPDGSTKSIDSKEALKEEIIAWKQNNPDVDGRPHIVFPFDIELKNGKVITINNKADLMKILRKCRNRKGGRRGRGNG